MSDKCCAGVFLLGLTCQECSSERFLASYSAWFEKLILFIQAGALRNETWRSNFDMLLISVAIEYGDKRWIHEQTVSLEELRVAALRTLMATLVSPFFGGAG